MFIFAFIAIGLFLFGGFKLLAGVAAVALVVGLWQSRWEKRHPRPL